MISHTVVERIMRQLTKVHSVDRDKIVCHCPMAQWEHLGGSDNSPSFAVIRGKTGWWVNCLACGYRNTLEGMIWDIMKRRNESLTEITRLIYPLESHTEALPLKEIKYNPMGQYSAKNRPAFKRREFAETIGVQVDLFRKDVVEDEPRPSSLDLDRWERVIPPLKYVEKRGITYDAYKEWRLGHNPLSRRLMFPVFNRKGEYVGYTGRLYEDSDYCFSCGSSLMLNRINKATGEVSRKRAVICPKCGRNHAKYMHFKGKWRRHVVYGLHRDVDAPIVVTEGTTDVIRLWMLGVARPVCILGANLSPNQVNELRDACNMSLEHPVIFLGDNDEAGREMARSGVEAMKKCGVDAFSFDCPAKDPDNMTYEQCRLLLPETVFR